MRRIAVPDISATQSAKFLDLVRSAAMGWLLIADLPGSTALLGGVLIGASTIWVAQGAARDRSRRPGGKPKWCATL